MARAGRIWHQQAVYRYGLGENVGEGPDVAALQLAFMNSPEHRANILDPAAQLLGIGTAWRKGILYVDELFAVYGWAPISKTPHPLKRVRPRPSACPAPS